MVERLKKICSYIFRRGNLRPLAVCAALLAFLWFAVFGEQGLYQLHKSIRLKRQLEKETLRLKEEIERLKEEKLLLNDPAHLELVIRQELGYIKPGELVFQQIKDREMSP